VVINLFNFFMQLSYHILVIFPSHFSSMEQMLNVKLHISSEIELTAHYLCVKVSVSSRTVDGLGSIPVVYQ